MTSTWNVHLLTIHHSNLMEKIYSQNMIFGSCLLQAITLFCSIITSLASTSSSSSTDRLSLLSFKDQITDDPFGALSSWNDSIHYCQWNGVACSQRHRDRVTVLNLQSQQLRGTLSPHIGNLTFLKVIALATNNFDGPIPQEVGGLFRLEYLNLNNNSFSGRLPSNLSHCSNLRKLYLVSNNLSGEIPVELSSLTKLLTLDLSKNKLKGSIPASLGNLSALSELRLPQNRLTGRIPGNLCFIWSLNTLKLTSNLLNGIFPSCFYNLSQITILDTTDNELDGIFSREIGFNLPNLQEFYVGGNKFRGQFPLSLLNASKLEEIELGDNQLTGRVPRDLGKLEGLRMVSLFANQLGSTSGDDLDFIDSMYNCSNLDYLAVAENFLQGSIPNSITNLSTKITNLLLNKNKIYGTIPHGIENLISLQRLSFSNNHLEGEIPRGLGMLPRIQKLNLNGNQLSGEIPESLGNLTLLLTLDLSVNQLHGKIPSGLDNSKNLMGLFLDHNELNGPLPIGLSSIIELDLSNNELNGPLPIEVGSMRNVVILDISSNRFSGHVPETLANCVMLKQLFMKANLLEGNITRSLSNLRSLEDLDLSRNKFSGEIPKFLMNLTYLSFLNLSYNELEGPVPEDGVFGNASMFSIVGNRDLCGGITGLELPPCRTKVLSKSKPLFWNVIIPIIVVSSFLILLACLFLILYKRRTFAKEPVSPSPYHDPYLRVSYAQLCEATNNFSATNLIGSGSYGTVYKGILDQVTTTIAVKVLNLQQRGAEKSFISECNALRNLRHRNLLKIVTSCSSVDFRGNDFKALVFEFMPNGSLEEWLHQKSELNFLQRLNIAIDVASALDYLHNQCHPTIVHCDLKPSNVLLDDDMTAHVGDFGLAKIISAVSSQSQETSVAIKGSIGYVAPEYGMGGAVSMQGDVYSYGILLLEMFTRKRPTDDMFRDGENLHSFAKSALPEQVMNIVDPMILSEGIESIASVIKLGVTCSAELPIGRLNMEQVVTELYHIRDCHRVLKTVESEK